MWQAKDARGFVKRLTRGVIDGAAKPRVLVVIFDQQELAMAAGDQQHQKGKRDAVGQLRRQSVPREVVHADQRDARRRRETLGAHDTGQNAADQARTGGDGNRVNVMQGRIRRQQRVFDYNIDLFGMGAGGNFRDNAAEICVFFGLAEHHVGQHGRVTANTTNDGRSGVVAAAFDAKNSERVRHGVRFACLRLGYPQVTLARNRHNGSGDSAMPHDDDPIVLITRPAEDARRFLAALEDLHGPVEAIVSPAFEYEHISTVIPPFEAAIFTSKVGVAHAPLGAGRPAWCVGYATAHAARGAGYDPISAGGTAQDLVALILDRKPREKLLHVRGEISRGDIMGILNAAGLNCHERIVYRKKPCQPVDEIVAALAADRNFVIPLFSGETVSIIADWALNIDGQNLVAISADVASEAQCLNPSEIVISDRPNMASMVRTTVRMIA